MLGTTMLSVTQQLLLSQMGRKLGFALSILLSLLQEQHSQGIITLGGKGLSLPLPSSRQGSEPKASQMRCTGIHTAACLCSHTPGHRDLLFKWRKDCVC